MLTKTIDNKEFVCFRPERKTSRLDADIFIPGLKHGLNIFLDEATDVIWLDHKIWFQKYLRPDFLVQKAFEKPDWFFYFLSVRQIKFQQVKIFLKEVNGVVTSLHSLSRTELSDLFNSALQVMREFVAYGMLANSDMYIVEKFHNLLRGILSEVDTNKYLFEILPPPSYVEKHIDLRISESKSLQIPPKDPLFLPVGEIYRHLQCSSKDMELYETFLHKFNIASPEEYINFSLCRVFAPIMYQLGQENHYVGKAVIGHVEHILFYISQIMIKSGQFENPENILDCSLETVQASILHGDL